MIREAIILAGGEGTRLRPVTLEIPKPLVPVQGVPIASWLVRWFARYGVETITVIYPTKWKKAFETWMADIRRDCEGPRVNLFEETEPLGTLGALVHEMKLGKESVYVTNGDELKGLDLERLSSFHRDRRAEEPQAAATVALIQVPNPSQYGVAEMDGPRITRFHEKPAIPPSSLVSSGLYVIEPFALTKGNGVLEEDPARFLMFEKDFFPSVAMSGRLFGCPLEGPWYDCGTMERWERAIQEWKGF